MVGDYFGVIIGWKYGERYGVDESCVEEQV